MIVYDLDGTLYRDTHHFVYYRDRLSAAAPRPAAFERDYEHILEERHPLRVGTFYDVRQRRVCTPEGVMTWEGVPVEPGSRRYDDLTEALEKGQGLEDWLYVGDLWWIMLALASYHDVPGEAIRRSFLATREYMMDERVAVPAVPGLREFVASRKQDGVIQVLATNSPEPDSRAIIRKLELQDLFDEWSFLTGKPEGLYARLREWGEKFGVSFDEMLVVGDNYRNDVIPGRRMGCRTVFIDPHRVPHRVRATHRVRRLEEIFPLWEAPGRPA